MKKITKKQLNIFLQLVKKATEEGLVSKSGYQKNSIYKAATTSSVTFKLDKFILRVLKGEILEKKCKNLQNLELTGIQDLTLESDYDSLVNVLWEIAKNNLQNYCSHAIVEYSNNFLNKETFRYMYAKNISTSSTYFDTEDGCITLYNEDIKLKFSGFGGDGTHKCYFTSKDVIDLYLFKFCTNIEVKKDLYIENSDSAVFLKVGVYNVFTAEDCVIIQFLGDN